MYELRFDILLRYAEPFLNGVWVAIYLTVTSVALGSVAGLILAAGRANGNRFVRLTCASYIEFFRNIPLLLILVFVFFALPLLGVRGIDKYWSAILALALYSAAYLAEVFRAGLEAIQSRYVEAAKSIGLSRWATFRFVLLPLMLAEITPALGNNIISIFKDTSLAASISVPEITFVGRVINTDTWRVVEAWTAVGAVYLSFGFLASAVVSRLEAGFSRWR